MARRPDSSARLEERWQKIQRLIEENRQHLMRQGSISARQTGKRRVWLLRFFVEIEGRRCQRSVFLGGDDQAELIQRARNMLNHLRVLGRCERQVAEDARAVRELGAAMRQFCKDISLRCG